MFHFKSKKIGFLVKFLISFATTLVLTLGGLYGYYLYIFSGMEIDSPLKPEEVGIEVQDYHADHITNIALFGVDSKDSSMIGRSDGIVIVTLDNEKKEIRLSSIERDSYVVVEGYGKTKINHAYAYGGPVLAVKTLNQNFGLDITDYLCINFTNLELVIDELGGIDLEVPEKYIPAVNKMITASSNERGITPKLITHAGVQRLNGLQTLCMMRERKTVGGTSARAEMHELVLTACFESLKEHSLVDYPGIAKTMLNLVKTTLSREDVVSVGTNVMISGYELRRAVFPLDVDKKGYGGKMINGVWYLTFDPEGGKEHLQDYIYQGILYGEQ